VLNPGKGLLVAQAGDEVPPELIQQIAAVEPDIIEYVDEEIGKMVSAPADKAIKGAKETK
jgi:hypothetical protein